MAIPEENETTTLVKSSNNVTVVANSNSAAKTAASESSPSSSSVWESGQRWLILVMFVMYSASNAFQWTQLVIITNILEKYYQVSTLSVSWTSMIYMVTYIPLIFPASWFLQKQVIFKILRKLRNQS